MDKTEVPQDGGTRLARALAYHPQFKLFDMYWLAVTEDITIQKEEAKLVHTCTIKGVHTCTTKGVHDEHHYGGAHNLKEETSKENLKEEPLQELAHPPLAADALVNSSSEGKEEEGIQGEQVESTEPQHTPPAEPLSPEPDYEAIVEEAMSLHPLYLEMLGWPGLDLNLMIEAVEAERQEVGAGVALVVQRYTVARKEVGT